MNRAFIGRWETAYARRGEWYAHERHRKVHIPNGAFGLLVGPFPARGRRVALKACQRGRLELLQTGMPGKGCVAGELCCRRCQEKHSRN